MKLKKFYKQHKFILRSEYSKSGLRYLGQFEVEGYFLTMKDAEKSVSDIDGNVLKVLSIHRTPERKYLFPFIQLFRSIKYWYRQNQRKRNKILNIHHGY